MNTDKDFSLKEMMEDFANLLNNSWYYVGCMGLTPLPGDQERHQKYLKELHKKWESKLDQRFLIKDKE